MAPQGPLADFDVNEVAALGVIKDVPGFQLPPEAWTLGENVRFLSDGIQRMPGWARAFTTTTITGNPVWAVQLHTPDDRIWWLYASSTNLYIIDDGKVETNVSRVGGYNAPYWQGTFLGGIPIVNNSVDVPQYLATYNTATDFANLPNWPSNERCKVIRALGPYLVALHPTIAGVTMPHLVHWSHPADPGSVPISWNEADPTRDAGKNDLVDTEGGGIIEALPLRTALVIYKEHSTWLMRPVGGQFIFQFDQFLVRSGLMSRACVALTGDGAYHFVVTEDDIIIHDTVSVQPLLSKRNRRYLFNQIEDTARHKSYVFSNPRQKEMWFVYPETGSPVVNRAFIWNYGASGLGTCYEADYTYPWTAVGDIDVTTVTTWDGSLETWDTRFGAWNRSDRRRPVGVDTANKRFLVHDTDDLRDGETFTARAQRQGLAILGRRRSGEPVVDFQNRKFCRKLWPKSTGAPLRIRIGTQETVESAVVWSQPMTFEPTTEKFIDVAVTGAALSVDFYTDVPGDWRLYGYDLEIEPAGRY